MTAAATPKDGSPLSSTANHGDDKEKSPWPLADTPAPAPAPLTGRVEDASAGPEQHEASGVLSREADGQQQQQPYSSSGDEKKPQPWWKTRKAIAAYGAGAVLLVAFVVLLVLGLLGYLRKVGPFSNLEHQDSSSPSSSSPSSFSSPLAGNAVPNPLSTIPLMADPFAVPQPPPPVPTTPLPGPVDPTPTNLPTTDAVRNQSSVDADCYLLSPPPQLICAYPICADSEDESHCACPPTG